MTSSSDRTDLERTSRCCIGMHHVLGNYSLCCPSGQGSIHSRSEQVFFRHTRRTKSTITLPYQSWLRFSFSNPRSFKLVSTMRRKEVIVNSLHPCTTQTLPSFAPSFHLLSIILHLQSAARNSDIQVSSAGYEHIPVYFHIPILDIQNPTALSPNHVLSNVVVQVHSRLAGEIIQGYSLISMRLFTVRPSD